MAITLAQWAAALQATEAELVQDAAEHADAIVYVSAIQIVEIAQALVANLIAAGGT